ncbi:MAG: MarR family transcriptional regulator [Ruminococcaceae bacterium]|nr:MarR family transcriptional regulator [Oscillospiraceae bacterium]
MTNKNNNEKPCRRRPHMMINGAGEVVFVPFDGKEQKNHVMHKPTALMLCNEISKMFGASLRENTAEECPLTGSHRDIIFHLSRRDGRTQLELANLVHITPPSASVALVKLEEDGYIERRTDESDKRKVRIYLTEKGKRIDVKAREVIREIEGKAMEGFTEEEKKQLCVLLFRMRENISND